MSSAHAHRRHFSAPLFDVIKARRAPTPRSTVPSAHARLLRRVVIRARRDDDVIGPRPHRDPEAEELRAASFAPNPKMAPRRRSGGVGKQRPGPEAVEAALREATELFPRRSATLPALVLRHQLYGLAGDRTAVDRHLNRLQAEGRVRLLHLGLGPDTVAVVGAEEYRETVLRAVAGSPSAPLVRRFLDGAQPLLSFDRGQLEEMGLKDCDVTQLVAAGVLTVRDAGSWWLALPGAGRFVRALLHGRKQLLAAVRRSRHREVLQAELGQRRARPSLGFRYVLLDLLGAELLRRAFLPSHSVPTTSGPLLRLAET